MISYTIKYQTRRKEGPAGPQGNWQDEEKVVVVEEDARDAIDEIVDSVTNCDFRLIGVKIIGQVDIIGSMNDD